MKPTASGVHLVNAAQAGDQQALESLISAHLPLIYNVVGRALQGHPDTDDVVQETMIRAVAALPRLRDPDRFRSWLVAIAIRQTQERGRARGAALARQLPLDEWPEPADPTADPAGETVARVGLSAQRRAIAAATRLLTPSDRQLLALWWQEVGGVLSRAELASALGISQGHAAVRVQRMKADLELARAVVRAWRAAPRCATLTELAPGRSNPLRRLGRHVRDCPECRLADEPLVPAERLLTGAVALPVPALLAAKLTGLTVPAAAGLRRFLGYLNLKTAAVGSTVLAAGATAFAFAVYYLPPEPPATMTVAPPRASAAVDVTQSPVTASPSAVPSPSLAAAARADIFLAPDGDDANPGTMSAPVATLGRAAAIVRPGQTIAVRGGTYRPTTPVTITTSGTPSQRITLTNYPGEQPVFDASGLRSNQWFVTQRASYWTVQGLTVTGAPTYPFVCVSCAHNVYKRLSIHDNGATGLVLRGADTSANSVLDSDFHDNHDDAAHGANADGLAFKDGTGTGNLVRGVRAYANADDGIDLSGFASPVTITHSWAYGNGVNRWNLTDFAGAGTGFKLGGGDPPPPVAHVITDSAAWDNRSFGFTEQNNRGPIVVTGNTAWRNGSDGFAFWYSTAVLRDNLALANQRDDNRGDATQEAGNSWNQSGWTTGLFRSTDSRTAEGPRPADWKLPDSTFLMTRRSGPGATMTP
ncbi:sigma-70 family RNA polymerase sigma factor [Hamadaea tsunoensis]|uniref:sigma-70 family RNA polymerase sigma factor n=1 Tax=Hamadaea tsunoensis TaxID=53368 RepID=UPI000419272B|nr:sigma-70 family RNA polymerase sigma factor [Hamadaea tsunoensis]